MVQAARWFVGAAVDGRVISREISMDAAGVKDILVAVAAVGGLVLGIINTWTTLRARRPRIAVSAVMLPKGNGEAFGIEVQNLSAAPVTVTDVGFARAAFAEKLRARLRPAKVRISMAPIPSITETGAPLPVRLGPNEMVTLTGDAERWLGVDMPLRRVYARLTTGRVTFGEGPAMGRVRRMHREMWRP